MESSETEVGGWEGGVGGMTQGYEAGPPIAGK